MKKILILSFSLLLFCNLAKAQFDLGFHNFALYNTITGNRADTVLPGGTYLMVGSISNNNNVKVDTTLTFGVWVGKDMPSFKYKERYKLSNKFHFSIPKNGQGTISCSFKIVDSVYKCDSLNIVIIWPVDSYTDDNIQNNYASAFNVFDKCTVGMEESSNESLLSIFPNPASDFIILKNKSDEICQSISIINSVGKSVYFSTLNYRLGAIRIPFSDFFIKPESGVYFLEIVTANRVQRIRFVLL